MQAEHWQCSLEDYHASEGFSKTQIDDFLDNHPLYFYEKHIDKSVPNESKDCYKVGTAVHGHVLLRNFDDRIVLPPKSVLASNGARSTNDYYAWEDEQKELGNIIATEKQLEDIKRMCDAVWRNSDARQIIEESRTEYSVRWECPITGLKKRCRYDCFHPALDADLKTCQNNSPYGFAKSIASFRYYRQERHYGEGSRLIRGKEVPWYFLAVTTHSCHIYQVDDEFKQAGERELLEGLQGIKRCLETGVWDYEQSRDAVLSPPGFFYSERQYEVEEV